MMTTDSESPLFAADILLACGHGWPGECESRAEAEEFVALCVLTGDTARCPECGEMQAITGPLMERTTTFDLAP